MLPKSVRVRLTRSGRVSAERSLLNNWASVSDESAIVSQVAGSVPRHRSVDQGGDLKLETLSHFCICIKRNIRSIFLAK